MISEVQMDLTVKLNVKYTQNGSAIKFENECLDLHLYSRLEAINMPWLQLLW